MNITAIEAKRLSEEGLNKKLELEFEDIMLLIKRACEEGKTSIQINYSASKNIKKLEELGYRNNAGSGGPLNIYWG